MQNNQTPVKEEVKQEVIDLTLEEDDPSSSSSSADSSDTELVTDTESETEADRERKEFLERLRKDVQRRNRTRRAMRTRYGLDEYKWFKDDEEEFNNWMNMYHLAASENDQNTMNDLKIIIKRDFGCDLDKIMKAPYH